VSIVTLVVVTRVSGVTSRLVSADASIPLHMRRCDSVGSDCSSSSSSMAVALSKVFHHSGVTALLLFPSSSRPTHLFVARGSTLSLHIYPSLLRVLTHQWSHHQHRIHGLAQHGEHLLIVWGGSYCQLLRLRLSVPALQLYADIGRVSSFIWCVACYQCSAAVPAARPSSSRLCLLFAPVCSSAAMRHSLRRLPCPLPHLQPGSVRPLRAQPAGGVRHRLLQHPHMASSGRSSLRPARASRSRRLCLPHLCCIPTFPVVLGQR
jgi:hypothetical protein